jgi:putative DNA primase/helicase
MSTRYNNKNAEAEVVTLERPDEDELQVFVVEGPSTIDFETHETIPGRRYKIACGFHLTETGNAQRFVAHWHDSVRYCNETDSWYIWNGVKWEVDVAGKIYEMAKEVVQNIHVEAGLIRGKNRNDTKSKRGEVTKWAYSSESEHTIKAMLKLARTDREIRVDHFSDFNANRDLINFPNGTLERKARVFREHRREDMLTKVTAVPYDPTRKSKYFIKTLLEAMPIEEVRYAQKVLGSFLEATTQNKEWLYIYGRAYARKSSCTQPLYRALGDYAREFDIGLLMKSHRVASNKPRPELVDLEGVLIAWTEEAPPNFVIDDAILKKFTSSGIVSTRQLHEKQRNINLVCSFVVESNGTFTFDIDDEDSLEAALDRTKVMKFVHSVPRENRDAEILKALTHDEDELVVALAFYLQGYFDRIDEGLEVPESVQADSEEFQAAINPLNRFVREEIVFDDGSDVQAEVYTPVAQLFQQFLETEDVETLKKVKNSRSFSVHFAKIAPYRAKAAGIEIENVTIRNVRVWRNVRLADIEKDDMSKMNEPATKYANTQNSENCTLYIGIVEFYIACSKSGLLRICVQPKFPDIQVQNCEPLRLDFLNELENDSSDVTSSLENELDEWVESQ